MDEEHSVRGPQDRLRFRHRNCTVVVANYGTPDEIVCLLADAFWEKHKLVLPAPPLLRFHLEDGGKLKLPSPMPARGLLV